MVVWIVFSVALVVLIVASWLLASSGRLENRLLRNGFVVVGASVGIVAFLLVFVEQPRFHSVVLNHAVGIPLMAFGLAARVYAALYLRKMGTTTTLANVAQVIDTGPYSIVRHPQYVTGILSLIGWFMIWGAVFCLYLVPLIALVAALQAYIEEKTILEKQFGEAYERYKMRVGMFFPRFR